MKETLTFKEKIEALFDPYSIGGLKMRLNKLPDCPYKLFLKLALEQLQKKVVRKEEAKKAIEYIRTGDVELLKVAVEILKPDKAQVDIALALLRSGKLKEKKGLIE
jgi:hypothetical protein